MTAVTVESLRDAGIQARAAEVRLGNAIAHALLEGLTQADVARALGVTQPAVSQRMRGRQQRTLGPYWTIPVLAATLASDPQASVPNVVRACAQFVADFRRIADPLDREAALGAPAATGVQRLDGLVAALADYEAHRAGLPTPSWAVSERYDMFPSWFMVANPHLTAYAMSVTPPQFSVRGVFLDPRDLESV